MESWYILEYLDNDQSKLKTNENQPLTWSARLTFNIQNKMHKSRQAVQHREHDPMVPAAQLLAVQQPLAAKDGFPRKVLRTPKYAITTKAESQRR